MSNNNLYPLTKSTEFRFKMYPKDFYKVKDFYENTLGYPVIDGWDSEDDKGVMFDAGAAGIEVMASRDGFLPSVQGVGLALMVEDVWSLWEKLKDHPNIIKKLRSRPWGDISFRITDPEGFQISFFTHAKLKKSL